MTSSREKIALLFDIYGNLLTEKQRESFGLYFDEDLSITEIAQESGISRAAVHDALKTAEKALLDYERKLGLLEKKEKMEAGLAELKEDIPEAAKKIDKLIEQL